MRTEGETLTFTHIPDKAKVQVFLKDGTCFTGTLRQSAGVALGIGARTAGTIQPGGRLAQVRRGQGYRGAFEQTIRRGGDAEIRGNCIHSAKNEAGIRR